MKEYYRIDEVARIFDVNKRTVERLIARKELVAVKVRGCTRIHRSDLDGYRKKQKNCDRSRQ